MRFFFLVGVAVAQLLRTTPTGVKHAEKIEDLVKHLAAHTGANSTATFDEKMMYTLQTLEKVEQEAIASHKSKGQEDPLTDEMFNPVIDQVRGIVRGNVKDTVDGLANQAVATVKKMEKCSTDLSFDATAESSGYNAAKDALTQSADDSEEECKDVTTGEDARDNAGKTLYENVKNSVGCSQTAHVDDVPMDALNFPLKNINTWAQTVITQHKEWLDAANKVVTTKGDCSENKLDNAESCSTLEHLAAKGKQAYETCYNKALGEYRGAVAALISASQATMRPQIDMVESLICYIRVAIREWDNPEAQCSLQSEGKLSCRCDSDQGEVYSNILYDFQTHLGPYDLGAPEKDTSWDGKGCEDAALADPCEDISGKWHDKSGTELVLVTDESNPCEGKESSGAWSYTVKGESPNSEVVITLSDGTIGTQSGKKPERTISWDNGYAYTEGDAPSPMAGFALVPSDSMPSGYRAVSVEELNEPANKAAFIKQYNERGLVVPVKFVSQNCCIMLASKLKMTVNCVGNCGYVYPGLNGQMLCNPGSGYDPATNYKFGYGYTSDLPDDSVFREITLCADYNNPMLAVPT
jgi:hypothetical protein